MQTMEYQGYASVVRKANSMKSKIADVLSRSKSISEACRMLNMNNVTLKKYCQINGQDLTPGKRGVTRMTFDEAKASELYDLNVPFAEIGEQLGVNMHLVRRWAIETNRSRPNPSIRRLRTKLDPRTSTIMALRLEGNTLESIGQKFGVTRERIRQIVDRYADSQVLDRQFAETCIELKARGYTWAMIQEMMGSECSESDFKARIEHLFTDEEKAKYFC